jgi:hypothetical protein
MIELVFGNDPFRRKTLGPAPAFRIGGNFIRQAPDMEIVATYRNHYWETQGEHFVRYDCFSKAEVRFEDITGGSSERFGPFDHFWTADGVLYAEEKPLAQFRDDSQLWHCIPTDTYWPFMVILEAKETS